MHPAANPFDTVTGLPLHPLVVHAAVVLFPLGLLALLAVLVAPRLRRAYGWPALALLVVGAVFVPVAKESGEQLAHHVGEPRDHARYADLLTAVAFATVVVALLWWLLDRLAARRAAAAPAASGVAASGRGQAHGAHVAAAHRPSLLGRLLAALAGLLALASLVLTVVVGHTGATATWKGEVASWSTASAPSATATASPVPSASASAAGARTYTMTQVTEHSTPAACWTAIDGSVYDLTTWIAQHPGGVGPIKGLCGTDGTAAFTAQHGEDTAPKQRLASFRIGALQG